jgi:precorrin-2 dehydrogenase/sirohydrochlorin ferrochelatase
LVLGGQDEAADKITRLVAAGANVVVFSPNVSPAISAAAQRGELAWLPRELDLDRDLEDTFLVMNTCRQDTETVQHIFTACRQRRILLNTYDEPELSDFGMAALVNRGHLRISISSSNASPTLAGKLRRNLESAFDEDFVEFLEQLGKIRRDLRHQITDGAKRRAVLKSLVDGFRLQTSVELPPDWRNRLQQVIEGDSNATGEPGSE